MILKPPVKNLLKNILAIILCNPAAGNAQSINYILHVPTEKEAFFGMMPVAGNRVIFVNIYFKVVFPPIPADVTVHTR